MLSHRGARTSRLPLLLTTKQQNPLEFCGCPHLSAHGVLLALLVVGWYGLADHARVSKGSCDGEDREGRGNTPTACSPQGGDPNTADKGTLDAGRETDDGREGMRGGERGEREARQERGSFLREHRENKESQNASGGAIGILDTRVGRYRWCSDSSGTIGNTFNVLKRFAKYEGGGRHLQRFVQNETSARLTLTLSQHDVHSRLCNGHPRRLSIRRSNSRLVYPWC
eukprot:2055570-Rhodomonas_salina.2